jgi:hypothetical protein
MVDCVRLLIMIRGINKPVLLEKDKKDRGDALEAGGALTGPLPTALDL